MAHRGLYLSAFVGTTHVMEYVRVDLSDCGFIWDGRNIPDTLVEGDPVLCEMEVRDNCTRSIRGMAHVLEFAEDGITPARIQNVLGEPILLDGDEIIIDHRYGHTTDCACGIHAKRMAGYF